MHEAAASDGIDLKILSATRNFNEQKRIWEAKWTGERLVQNNENLANSTPDPKERALKILRWSSMPGSSRHHWGTDIDLNAFENNYFESGEGLKIYNWLTSNASSFGYCQPYTPKNDLRPNGYNEEKWHWSYLPIAKPLSDAAKAHLKNEMIKGFKGSETAVSIDILNNFILGINNACL
jgi:LAS superfamily LD-carboxypeptidase LdcB